MPSGQDPSGQLPQAQQQPAPRPKAFTALTWAILALGLVLVAGSGWLAAQHIGERFEIERTESAPAVLEKFLSAAARGDEAWRKNATPALQKGADGTYAPLYGDYATGDSLQMKISYEVDEQLTAYRDGGRTAGDVEPEQAATAAFTVDFTFEFTHLDETYTSQIRQVVWLTRPFYIADTDAPEAALFGEKPASVGPWQVAGFSRPSDLTYEDGDDGAFTSVPPTEDDSTELLCQEMHGVLADLSEYARQTGALGSSCLYGGGKLRVQADGLKTRDIAAGFPVLNDTSPLPQELIGLDTGGDFRRPIVEYPIEAGGKRYVFTAVATAMSVDGSTEQSFYRLIWLEEAKAR